MSCLDGNLLLLPPDNLLSCPKYPTSGRSFKFVEKLGPLTLSVSNSRHAIVVAIITMCALGTSYGFKGLSLFCYLTLAILLLRYVRQRLSPL